MSVTWPTNVTNNRRLLVTFWLRRQSPSTMQSVLMNRGHSFPRNAEFWAEPRNLPISAEFLCFHGILQNSVLDSDKETNTAYFDGVQATILYVYMISPCNTWLPLGLRREEYWKYWAELIWNIAGLFGRQSVSVSCSYQRQILHIWSGSEVIEN